MTDRKYFKFDEINQFLEDEADINYFTTNQARKVAVGNMLGDFDENGFYVIDKKIVKELVAIPKIIVDSIDNVDLVKSAIKFDAFLHFMVSFDEDKARLILLEKINFESNIGYNSGSYSNMNEYVLDEVQIPDRDVDRNIIYTRFNIVREDQGRVFDINNLTPEEQLNFEGIISKMKYNFLAQNELLLNEKAVEKIEADYFDNVLNSFDDFPKEKENFKMLVKKVILDKIAFIKIGNPFFQKTINEMLDSCLTVFLRKLSPAERDAIEKKIRKVKEKYFREYNKLLHIQFINSLNAQKEVGEENIISEVIHLRNPEVRVMKMKVDETKMDKSLNVVIEENAELRKKVSADNGNEKTVTAFNPELKQFFKEFKDESGIDVLKDAPKSFEVKQPEIKKPEPKAKEKSPERKKAEEDKKPEEVSQDDKSKKQEKAVKPDSNSPKVEPPKQEPQKKTQLSTSGLTSSIISRRRHSSTRVDDTSLVVEQIPQQKKNTKRTVSNNPSSVKGSENEVETGYEITDKNTDGSLFGR